MNRNLENSSSEITIIIPVYNGEKYIARAVESVLNQTFKNYELIVIDDGSTDATGRIIDDYAQRDERIRVIHQENHGRGYSRNKGVKEATGEYLSFCDADDVMHADMLEKMYAYARQGVELIVCNYRFVDENGTELPWKRQYLKNKIISGQEAFRDFLITETVEGFCWNKLVKKSLFVDNNILFDESKLSFEEVYANALLVTKADKVAYVDNVLYDYYQIASSCIHTLDVNKNYNYLDTLDSIYNEAVDLGMERYGKVYTTYRLYEYLYDIMKNENLYDKCDFDVYFKSVHNRYLKNTINREWINSFVYPMKNPLKHVVKAYKVYYR